MVSIYMIPSFEFPISPGKHSAVILVSFNSRLSQSFLKSYEGVKFLVYSIFFKYAMHPYFLFVNESVWPLNIAIMANLAVFSSNIFMRLSASGLNHGFLVP